MIKITHFKNKNWSQLEFFCDNCFDFIELEEPSRSKEVIKENGLDLCRTCQEDWDRVEEGEK